MEQKQQHDRHASAYEPEAIERYRARVADRLVRVDDFSPEAADSASRDAFAFIELCAKHGREAGGLTPTRIVDKAWHAAILFTKEYATLCRSFGRFVHHAPHEKAPSQAEATAAISRTLDAFASAGIPYDSSLWSLASAVDSASNCCAECNCNAGCQARD